MRIATQLACTYLANAFASLQLSLRDRDKLRFLFFNLLAAAYFFSRSFFTLCLLALALLLAFPITIDHYAVEPFLKCVFTSRDSQEFTCQIWQRGNLELTLQQVKMSVYYSSADNTFRSQEPRTSNSGSVSDPISKILNLITEQSKQIAAGP